MSRLTNPFWTRYRKTRDLIFFDQRGTGFSDPRFCPELDFIHLTVSFRGLSTSEQKALLTGAVADCRQSMLAKGIDFAFYNSTTSARDLDDLRKTLGYDTWNLYGISYGTRLALTAMRDTPEGIRSVIIDSNWPLNAPLGDDYARLMRSLNLVFEQCGANADCRARFPNLKLDFFAMLDDFEANPMILEMSDPDRFPDGRIVVDGSLLASGVFQGLYDRDFIGILPLMVRELGGRNADVLTALADGLVREPDFSSGLSLAVNCYEWIPRITPSMIEADRAQHPELSAWKPDVETADICESWHAQRAPASEQQAVYSNIPTLVAAGEFGPITPPSYSQLTAAGLPNSTYILVPGSGHAAIPYTECTEGIMEAFLEQPTATLDTSCIAGVAPASFTTDVLMNPGIYRLAKLLQGEPSLIRMAGLGLILLLLLSTLIIWPSVWVVRRLRHTGVSIPAGASKARWTAVSASLLGLGFLAGLIIIVLGTAQDNPLLLGFGVPAGAGPIFVLPWLMIAATIGVALFTVAAWRRDWWSLAGRVHYLLVAIACVSFIVWVFKLGLF
ncbi:MAG: alpha/beta hydrolase [Gammaproteobacteria bacterium]|nr:alpha/beta hydrolase [Gammaproteobacteria bacterium]